MRRTSIPSFLLALSIVLSACAPLQNGQTQQSEPSVPRGKFDPPPTMPDFALTDQDGAPFRFSSLRGKAVMLFFGYTHCPDVCPLTMAQFRVVKSTLDDDANRTAFVMISVDGLRDVPEVMKTYVQKFDRSFIGLTGDEDSVRKIAEDYGTQFFKLTPDPTLDSSSTTIRLSMVGHTSFSYLLDTQGRKRFIYKSETPIEVIVADIRQVLREAGVSR